MPPSSTQKFSGIFISYRRDDAPGHAGRLSDRLVEHFGRDRIFMDIDNIEPGEDFVTVIENAVGSCEILIAVIGQNWHSGSASGRLDNPNDFVRLEIGTALRRNIRVIPVLVQRASVPKPQDLPEELVNLTRRNAIELSDHRWLNDVDELISVMEKVLADEPPKERHEAPVRESNPAARENRPDAPATIVTPANKHRHLILVAGASLIVLLTAAILIWRSSGNANQPAPSPSPHDLAFGETLWKRDDTGTTLKIVRDGNTVRAEVAIPSKTAANAGRRKGDLQFEGRYEGRTIKGTYYNLLSNADDVRRCPTFGGDQPFELNLTLSEDGNTLSGSRADYKLSADCNIKIKLPTATLTYTKASP